MPSWVRPSSSRPVSFFRTPPHCLKKKGTPESAHWSRIEATHSGFMSRAPGPLSPPTITQSMLLRSSVPRSSSSGSIERKRTAARASRSCSIRGNPYFCRLASSDPDHVASEGRDVRYRQAFIDALHDLCADGRQVHDVVCSVPTWRVRLPELHLDADLRRRLGDWRDRERNRVTTSESRRVVEGRLCGVQIRAQERWILIETNDGEVRVEVEDERWDATLLERMWKQARVTVRARGARLVLEALESM